MGNIAPAQHLAQHGGDALVRQRPVCAKVAGLRKLSTMWHAIPRSAAPFWGLQRCHVQLLFGWFAQLVRQRRASISSLAPSTLGNS